jgi:hypothetical protein
MTIGWVALLVCFAVAILLILRVSARDPALSRLALLHGVERMVGESEESLRNRTAGAARWPYSRPEPKFVWWARAWFRMTRPLRRG